MKPRSVGRILALVVLLLTGRSLPGASAESLPWLATQENAGIVYFAYTSPPRIERYDLAAQVWLSDIGLAEAPTAFTVDPGNLFVSFGRRTSRFTLAGTGETHLKNTPANVSWLAVMSNQLLLQAGGDFWNLNKLTGAELDTASYFYSLRGVTAAPTLRKIFGRTTGISPSDIVVLSVNADGTFGTQNDSPYHGAYPDASQTYVFPGEARVTDDSGIVYNANNLSYANSLGGRFDDLAFYGDLPIVLRSGELFSYSNAFLETGRYKPARTPLKIAVRNGFVFSFYQGTSGIEAEHFSIDLLAPSEPGQPVDPNGLAYVPDAVVQGTDDVVYLLSRANLSVFRWSIPLRRYLETIPLVEAPSYMAYSAATHRLYLAYPSSAIRQIDLATSTHETPFANLPQEPRGLSTAGAYVFACDPSGAWATHYVYHPDGSLLAQRDWNYISAEYVWSEANRRMYFFRDDTSPNDVHWEEIRADGSLGNEGESPYHGEIRTLHPIRVSPEGSLVVLGSGEIFDAHTLVRTDALSNDVSDAAWNQGTLFTLRPAGGGSEIQRWGQNYSISAQRTLPGTPIRLFGRGDHLLALTGVDGIPRFSLWDNALNEFSAPSPPLDLGGGRFTVAVLWRTPDGGTGVGHGSQLTSDTGTFWFFDPANVEMIIKVLDGCSFNHRLWVFAGGLTNVQVEIVVVDNLTGEQQAYTNPQGASFQPIQDTAAFTGCPASLAGAAPGQPLLATGASLLLNNSRFNVETTWQTGSGASGTGQPVPLTSDTGYFWFFAPSNAEMVVKVLDGCAVNGHFWVFAGGLTNVQTSLLVTDSVTGATRTYVNPQGTAFQPIQDTAAFACH